MAHVLCEVCENESEKLDGRIRGRRQGGRGRDREKWQGEGWGVWRQMRGVYREGVCRRKGGGAGVHKYRCDLSPVDLPSVSVRPPLLPVPWTRPSPAAPFSASCPCFGVFCWASFEAGLGLAGPFGAAPEEGPATSSRVASSPSSLPFSSCSTCQKP